MKSSKIRAILETDLRDHEKIAWNHFRGYYDYDDWFEIHMTNVMCIYEALDELDRLEKQSFIASWKPKSKKVWKITIGEG